MIDEPFPRGTTWDMTMEDTVQRLEAAMELKRAEKRANAEPSNSAVFAIEQILEQRGEKNPALAAKQARLLELLRRNAAGSRTDKP